MLLDKIKYLWSQCGGACTRPRRRGANHDDLEVARAGALADIALRRAHTSVWGTFLCARERADNALRRAHERSGGWEGAAMRAVALADIAPARAHERKAG